MAAQTLMPYCHVPPKLRPLVDAGFEIFPLSPGCKKPRDIGWQTLDYFEFDFTAWDGSIGIRLKQKVRDGVTVKNGSLKFAGYPGIDIKTSGGFVVAPGTFHPETGKAYQLVDGALDRGVPVAPDELIEMRRKPARADSPPRPGVLDVDEMVELLSVLDPAEFGKGQYERFRALAMPCHDATGGGGLAEFLAWAAGDPAYGSFEDDERNERAWHGFEAGKAGGITHKTLLHEVVEADRPDLAAKIRAKIECEPLDFMWEPEPLDFGGDDG